MSDGLIPATDVVSTGRAAWTRLRGREVATWSDWLAVGRAVAIGRTAAMAAAKTNKPLGSTYNRLMRQWLHENGLGGVSVTERHSILKILEHLPQIELWRETLAPERRRKHNHPASFWVWRKATRAAASKRQARAAQPKPRTYGEAGAAVHWPQDFVRRAAMAMADRRTDDRFVLARAALEGAIRNRDDVLSLLDTTQRSVSAQPAALALA